MKPKRFSARRQRGSAMIEFVVVGPVITLIGLAILQYAMLFTAKGQVNHASFMAARAGSVANADLDSVLKAYTRALVPIYGGGRNTAELAESYGKVMADMNLSTLRIELLNPTRESFDDFATDAALNAKNGARTIRNSALAHMPNVATVGSNSGQSLQDANLIKLRITHGYEPKVPLVRMIYGAYLRWLDPGVDAFKSELVNNGRIPIETHVTLEMQSDPIESGNISNPGPGNNGVASSTGSGSGSTGGGGTGGTGGGGGTGGSGGSGGNGGSGGSGSTGGGNTGGGTGGGGSGGGGSTGSAGGGTPPRSPPDCLTIGCTVPNTPVVPVNNPGSGGPVNTPGTGGCTGSNCPFCPVA